MKNGGRKAWVLLLVLLAGVLIGGGVWQLLLTVLPASLDTGLTIGSTTAPWTIDLYLVKITFGIVLRINPGSVAGLLTGLLLYFWKR